MTVQRNKVVTINYTLTDESGSLLESSEGQEPLTYLHGVGNLIPGLEASLEGKSAGTSLEVSVPPEEGYGVWDQEKIVDIPKSQFSGVDKVEVGMQFSVQSEAGEEVVTVSKVEGDIVTIDANHPLAGKILSFDVTIVGIRDATAEELDHGHVHGHGGHH
ncbi:MAG TPA: peptidylprolyl isomerase [Bacteroidetes bacterium]|nr:peptidylprolyl isomerase [Bacteroidota bacterium]